jgi:hypothetical protein
VGVRSLTACASFAAADPHLRASAYTLRASADSYPPKLAKRAKAGCSLLPLSGGGKIDHIDFSRLSAPEISALPGASSRLSVFTTPSSITMA